MSGYVGRGINYGIDGWKATIKVTKDKYPKG